MKQKTTRTPKPHTAHRNYDLAIIGGGSAGYNAARTATSLGLKTAVIDGAAELGGLCILRGCMPSKTLLHVADTLHAVRHAAPLGLRIPRATPDMPAIQARKRRIIADFASYRQNQLHNGDFALIPHYAHFLDPHTLALSNGETLRARHILIATGSRISTPSSIPGLADAQCWTSDDILDLDFIPKTLVVLGGGIVACELAQLLARLGTRVTLIQRSAQLLRDHSAQAADVIRQSLEADGVEIFTNTQLLRVSRKTARGKASYTIEFEHKKSANSAKRRDASPKREVVTAQHCLNALGRTPHTAPLALDLAGVKTAPSGHILANRWQQTTAPHIYAAGDCTGPHEIVHLAIQQAELAVRHIAAALEAKTAREMTSRRKHLAKEYGRRPLLSVVFTDPQLAQIGLSERDLKTSNTPYLCASYPYDDHGKAILLEATRGYAKVFASPRTGRLLGAEIVGRDSGELIHCFSTPLAMRATVFDMLRAPWYHPTLAEILTYPLEEIADQISAAKTKV
ncbi:pyridine nucleotide-disulfide oxidoreductase [Cephaloticoccus capnophilus]|uniref:Pyridine nucleotide-disulfide oxidoreductase n=1 Tax=Cephaloticoccus capnophilus TaxID=1548208 RepID=A0A139SKJ4_9BACT|nr:NAD(P)/FAD-dependent oxidoreductase [Cephaloticoccus capnophilus]KXU35050.1 pyridine nucleotide-disulfide oxidoreductase [Cephaloticoccus capnophilus]